MGGLRLDQTQLIECCGRGALEEYRAACTLDPTDTLYKQRYERLLHRVKK